MRGVMEELLVATEAVEAAELFEPKCVACGGEIPKVRQTSRAKFTCSPECREKLTQFQKERRAAFKCPTCQHPSTPAQREEFRAWRRHRGDKNGIVGRPPVKRVKLLEDAAREFLSLESETRMAMVESEAFDRARTNLQNLVDTPKQSRTLGASALSTPGDESDGS